MPVSPLKLDDVAQKLTDKAVDERLMHSRQGARMLGGMSLMVEFTLPIGEGLEGALPSVESSLDKELGELGFEKVRSLHGTLRNGHIGQKICYGLRGTSEPVSLGSIQNRIQIITNQENRQTPHTGQITRLISLEPYLANLD